MANTKDINEGEDSLQQMALPRRKRNEMSMGTWMATEGGRKCPMCGRYAKARDLGWIGFNTPEMCLDMYGHLPGKGCNRRKRQRQSCGGQKRH